jgi:hypothetical protein
MGPDTWTGKLYAKVLGGSSALLVNPIELEKGPVLNSLPVSNLQMRVYGPFGSLSVDLKEATTVALIAGGVGITPMRSIFLDLLYV